MRLTGDVASRMSWVIVLRAGGAGLGLFANIAIARSLGPSGAGIYFLALTLVTVASVISRLGLDQVFLRHAAADLSHGNVSNFAQLYRNGILLTAASGLLMTFLLFAFRDPIGSLFSDKTLGAVLAWMAFAVIPISLGTLYGELLKGIGASNSALLLQAIVVPLIVLITVAAGVIVIHPYQLAGIFTLANLLVGLAGYVIWRAYTGAVQFGSFRFAVAETWRLSSPLFVVALTNFGS